MAASTHTTNPPEHLMRVYDILVATYGIPEQEPDYDPLGGLVGTILSQHTSDKNSGRAYQQLIENYPTWEEVRDAPTYKVAEAIKSGGLANVKARRIQDVLHDLTDRQIDDGYTGSLAHYLLAVLKQFSPEDGWHYLRSFPGVGPKTAACVMLFDMNEPIMPVDTHVARVSRRLGLIGPKVTADQAHLVFAQIAPPEWVHTLHIDLIRHGRQICHAQKPDCNHCPLYSECAYVGSVREEQTAL
jgi:endonuclease-3